MRILKQSTSIKVPVGPCVDATDGYTLETAIAWASGEAGLYKNDAAAITNIGANTWSSHLGGGIYNVTLSASDTDTPGLLTLVAYDSAMRPFRSDYMVVPANTYDSLIAGTDKLQVDTKEFDSNAASGFLTGTDHFKADVQKINNNTTAADNLSSSALAIVPGTVSTGSTTTVVTTTLTETTNDHYNGRTIIFISGALAGQSSTITDYSGASRNLTVAALTEAPANLDTFVIV